MGQLTSLRLVLFAANRVQPSKMKVIVFLALAVFGYSAEIQHYPDSLDKIDYVAAMGSDRALESYMDCLVRDKSCTRDARELKTALPEIIATICAKCTASQKAAARRIGLYLAESKPLVWEQILKKYDPEGKSRVLLYRFLHEEPEEDSAN